MRFMKGFTLLELMITIAVTGILASVAYPSYQQHMRKAHRTAAQAHLMDITQRQQQFFVDSRSYASSVDDLSIQTPREVLDFYTISITPLAGPPPSFRVTATPKPSTIQTIDGPISIDHTGEKTPSSKW